MSDIGAAELISVAWIKSAIRTGCGIAAGIYNKQNVKVQ